MIQDLIIVNAKKYIGKPYVWGGESEAEGGFDCSGYIYNVLKDSGIKVSRSTAQGYYNKFKNNPCDKSIKGALLFFGKGKTKITHIAISSGDGIHMYESIGSSSNTKTNKGKGVSQTLISRRKDLVYVAAPFEIKKDIPVLAACRPNLKQGSKGTQVKYLQQDLNYVMNKTLVVDGVFGPKTKGVLIEFQKKHNLTADGIYGSHSHAIMKGLLL